MTKIPRILARLGLASCFVTFGVWEIVAPTYWVSYMPSLAARIAEPSLLVRIHGAALLVVGLMVLLGILKRFSALAAVLIMISIVASLIVSSGFTEIVVRDIAILFLALSLFVDSLQRDWR